MVELMRLVMRLAKLRAEICSFSSPQLYMLNEAEDLEKEIEALARKMDMEAMLK